jgi:hypothetical protein
MCWQITSLIYCCFSLLWCQSETWFAFCSLDAQIFRKQLPHEFSIGERILLPGRSIATCWSRLDVNGLCVYMRRGPVIPASGKGQGTVRRSEAFRVSVWVSVKSGRNSVCIRYISYVGTVWLLCEILRCSFYFELFRIWEACIHMSSDGIVVRALCYKTECRVFETR